MKKIILICSAVILSLALFYSCSSSESSTQSEQGGNSLVIYCPHPLEFIDPLVDEAQGEDGLTEGAEQ